MIIDIHSHIAFKKIFPSKFMSEISDSFPVKKENERLVINHIMNAGLMDSTASTFLNKMDDARIDKSVLLIADFGIALGEPELSLEQIFELHKEVIDTNPDRFIVFGGVDPRRGVKGVELFEKSIIEYKFKGLKLYPPCGFELDDPGLYPLYEICNLYGLPVLTHTGPSLKILNQEKKYPSSILKVASEFKNIKFVLGHGGARDCDTTREITKKRKNVFFDISTFQRFLSREEMNIQFRSFCDECPDRIMFGTDYPMFLLSATQKKLVETIENIESISSNEKEAIFYKNACHVLNIEEKLLVNNTNNNHQKC